MTNQFKKTLFSILILFSLAALAIYWANSGGLALVARAPVRLDIQVSSDQTYGPDDTPQPIITTVSGLPASTSIQSAGAQFDGSNGKVFNQFHSTRNPDGTVNVSFEGVQTPLFFGQDGPHTIDVFLVLAGGKEIHAQKTFITDFKPPAIIVETSPENDSTHSFTVKIHDDTAGFSRSPSHLQIELANKNDNFSTKKVSASSISCASAETRYHEAICYIVLGKNYNPKRDLILLAVIDLAGNSSQALAGPTFNLSLEKVRSNILHESMASFSLASKRATTPFSPIGTPLSESGGSSNQFTVNTCKKITKHNYIFHLMDDAHWTQVMQNATSSTEWDAINYSLAGKLHTTKTAYQTMQQTFNGNWNGHNDGHGHSYTPPDYGAERYTLVVPASQVSTIPLSISQDPTVDIAPVPDNLLIIPQGETSSCILNDITNTFPPFCFSINSFPFTVPGHSTIIVTDKQVTFDTRINNAYPILFAIYTHFKHDDIPTLITDDLVVSDPNYPTTGRHVPGVTVKSFGITYLSYSYPAVSSSTPNGFDQDRYNFVYAHEMGHSLGLGHNRIENQNLMWEYSNFAGINLNLDQVARAQASLCSEGLKLNDGVISPIPAEYHDSYCDPNHNPYATVQYPDLTEECESNYSGYEPYPSLLKEKNVTQFCPLVVDGAGNLILPTPFAITDDPQYINTPHYFVDAYQHFGGPVIKTCIKYALGVQNACTCQNLATGTITPAGPGTPTPPAGSGHSVSTCGSSSSQCNPDLNDCPDNTVCNTNCTCQPTTSGGGSCDVQTGSACDAGTPCTDPNKTCDLTTCSCKAACKAVPVQDPDFLFTLDCQQVPGRQCTTGLCSNAHGTAACGCH